MIASWKDFFVAVEQMRQCQKEYSRTNGPCARLAAKKCEAAVDACIEEKRAEWARQIQPELLEVTNG
jgi:excinuclease UvrABC nuclease subunit